MTSNDAWERLGIAPTADQSVIRKTYAELVRQFRPDSHPVEFAAVRSAYEEALAFAHGQPAGEANAAAAWRPAAPEPSPSGAGPYDWNLEAEQAMVRQAMDRRDAAALIAWLDEAFAKARNGTFDAMQDFEAFLTDALLSHAAPPPAFVEACARKLDWPARWPVLSTFIGDDACLRLRGLLHLAAQYRFTRNFAANPWQRLLFADASARLPEVGWTPLLLRANKAVQEWRQQCGKYGFEGYLSWLNATVVSHVSGESVQSCDLKHAFLVTLYALLAGYKAELPFWGLALLGVSVFAAMSTFRPAWRWGRAHFPLDRALRWILKLGLALAVLAFICGLAEHEISAILWLQEPLSIFKAVCFGYLLAVMLWIHWWMVRAYDTEARVFMLRKMDRADDVWWERENGESE